MWSSFLEISHFSATEFRNEAMSWPTGSKKRKQSDEGAVKLGKRQKVQLRNKKEVPSRENHLSAGSIVAADELKWREVALPDRLDDAEGFLGLEEIDDVEVIKEDGERIHFRVMVLYSFIFSLLKSNRPETAKTLGRKALNLITSLPPPKVTMRMSGLASKTKIRKQLRLMNRSSILKMM